MQSEPMGSQSLTTLNLYLLIAEARGDEPAMNRIRAAITDIYRRRAAELASADTPVQNA